MGFIFLPNLFSFKTPFFWEKVMEAASPGGFLMGDVKVIRPSKFQMA